MKEQAAVNEDEIGQTMYGLIAELYPICRSITGDGLRQTLRILQEHIPLEIHEIPTGTRVFDWVVPREWNIRDAYIKNEQGDRIIDFQRSNLHVVNYSAPIHALMSLTELLPRLHTLPDQPDWIPYRTSYYQETWGFCLSHNQLEALEKEGDVFEVYIDSSLEDGTLSYGEYYIPGEIEDEVLISCHTCHPSLCNDNLSGVVLSTFLAKYISKQTPRYSYRFLFIPGTIGSITWLALNEPRVSRIKHGLVVACVGDPGSFTYKQSRHSIAEIDRAVEHVLKHSGHPYEIRAFTPYGYDERQYCSPGFNLPVGSLTRTPHGCFPEYHTSADNLNLVRPEAMAEALLMYKDVVHVLEKNRICVNTNPKCEPQLGRRGLYRAMGGYKDTTQLQMAMLWVLNLSDGCHTLLDVARQSGLKFEVVNEAVRVLVEHYLLEPVKN